MHGLPGQGPPETALAGRAGDGAPDHAPEDGRIPPSTGATATALPSGPTVAPHHFPAFDGLRAIAAILVLLVHTSFISGITFTSPFGIYTGRMEIGVSVFFLISGFLLYRPFAISHLTANPAPRTGAFWERRILRIVPAYWVALTVTTYVLHVTKIDPGIRQVAIHYLFLQIYFPSSATMGLGQAWSLCTEMSFYLALPAIAWAIGRRRRSQDRQVRAELVAIAVLYLVSVAFRLWALNLPVTKLVDGQPQFICVPHCAVSAPVALVLPLWLPARIDLFALGMLLAVGSAWWSERRSEPLWLSARWVPWAAWAGAAVVFWATAHLGSPLSPTTPQSPAREMAMQALYGAFAFLVLVPAVFGPQDRSAVRRLLRSWPMAALGVISYGIFLWHLPIANEYLKVTNTPVFAASFWVLTSVVFVASVVVASASYFGLEKPFLRLKGRIGWWNRPTGRAAAEQAEELTR